MIDFCFKKINGKKKFQFKYSDEFKKDNFFTVQEKDFVAGFVSAEIWNSFLGITVLAEGIISKMKFINKKNEKRNRK